MKTALLLTVMLLLACAAGAAQNCATPGGGQAQVSAVQPAATWQRYSASLVIDFNSKREVEQQAWRVIRGKKGKTQKLSLTPPQTYLRCMLAGEGDVLRFGCATGFRPVNPAQTPPNPSGFVEDTPNTTGTTLQTATVNTITYDCVRATVAPHHKPAAKK